MRGSTERTKKLRQVSISTEPKLSLERAEIETEIYQKYAGVKETPVLRAMVFEELMKKRKLYIGEGELIVGEKGFEPQTAPTFPELCCHTLEDFDVMEKRDTITFKVSEEDRKIHKEKIIPYWENRSIRQKLLESMTKEWTNCYEAGIFTEFMEQRAPGHTVADDKFYKKGFKDIKEEIELEIQNLDYLNDSEAYKKKAELEAMNIACDALIIYGKRYGDYAEKLAAEEKDSKKKKDLLSIAENCKVVPENKPETFAQAVQMYWFVHIGVTTELNTWDAFSPGRMDQYLYPFYKKELEEETITRDKAKEILECLWVKFNNQPAPPKVGVTMLESATYTDFANLNTGGINPETGEDGVNDVSYIILDVMDEMKLLQPSSNVQISVKNPKGFIKRACEVSREGWGQPAFYNTEELIEELLQAGKDIKDARYGGSSGCVETGAQGREAYILTGYFNTPKIFEITLNNGYDKRTKKQIGLKTGDPRKFKTYEELVEAYKKQLKYFIDIKIEGNNKIERIFAEHMPSPFLSTVVDDCIKKGKDYNEGGARYNTRYLQIVGIGTITDALTAVKKNVFEDKRFSMEELLKALDSNFEGYSKIRNIVLNYTPKYGNDDDYADNIMIETFDAINDMITGRPTVFAGTYRIDMLPTTCHIYFGKVTGATANGRLSEKPLTDGISPEKGADKNGPTAVIKSASKMDHVRTGGTLLNQKFTPDVLEGEEGIENFASFIRSYFKMGGHHIQFNVIRKDTLLDAQANPDEYKDLIVRVAGYSDHFNNLEKALQDEIIERTEQDI